jgi:hypothetical protein
MYSIVISVFAIVILSTIGALFQTSHHSLTGSTEDPPNGPAVAATVFTAVLVYAVRSLVYYMLGVGIDTLTLIIGVPCLLRFTSIPPLPRTQARGDSAIRV